MKIIAADDEKLALQNLTKAIAEAEPEAELVTFSEPEEVLDYAKDHPLDVAFLDVEMGTMTGIEVAKQLKIRYPKINIVFVTGYDKYMAQAKTIAARHHQPADKEINQTAKSFLQEPY